MKKIFSILMLAALAICTVTMVSCKPDSVNPPPVTSLVGTWSYTEGTDYFEYIFNANGTFIFREKEGGWETWTGTYSVQGNKLTLFYDDEEVDDEVCIFSINGNSLTLTFGDGDTLIFTRK